MIKVSIIVPVYNVEKYITNCIESLVKQMLNDIEIIIVNDGSKDSSQKIIDKYANEYKNIKSFIKENGGQGDARNFGLTKATGEYIIFVDSDDWLQDDAIENLYNVAKEHESDIVICDIEELYENGTSIIRNEINVKNDIQKAYMIAMPGFCNKLFKREFLEKISFKFPGGIFYEDLAIYPIVASKTNKINYIEKPLYKYRVHEGSTMKQLENSKKLLDIFKVFNIIENGLNQEEKKIFKDELEYIYIEHLLHAASLRFIKYNEDKNIEKISDIMRQRFPGWNKNKYYKKQNIKYKIVCNLIYMKKLNLLRKILK